ncbi:hypothetical protein KDH_71270 [Dictyobacter sp. S3.2.2.5]|uniref:Uncharacterized protein n=1 Tax=Dictyobacter halimunensis TaxID=3026934 RepID=A0ABQ6G1A8_9CHLR|nr:hypothetical protein KDH_71270 [Dictyobacter sp. S3.2.2.5]
MTTEKITFAKEKETMLLTLYPRALQSQWQKPILRDPWAEEAIQHIDYDFNKLYKKRLYRMMLDIGCTIVATRASTFDLLTSRYLADHPDATVLHLGCGMDSRAFRVDPPASIDWYDVDYPDVIDLRRQLYPQRPAVRLISSPLDNLGWLDEVPGDRPVLMVAEGVLPYLTADMVQALLHAITRHFPEGQMVFDAMPSLFVKAKSGSNVGDTGATFRWALDDPQDIKQLEPRLELVKEFRTRELNGFSRFPLWIRALHRAMELNSSLRRMDRILVYRF